MTIRTILESLVFFVVFLGPTLGLAAIAWWDGHPWLSGLLIVGTCLVYAAIIMSARQSWNKRTQA